MKNQRETENKLRNELKNLRENYNLGLDLIEKNNARISMLESRVAALKTDRDFLLCQIKTHRQSIVLHTEPDSLLYGAAKEVQRNPSR